MVLVNVELNERRYPIHIGRGLLQNPDSFSLLKAGDKVMVVSNSTIANHYLEILTQSLCQRGCSVESVLIPEGEAHKNVDSLTQIFTALLEKNYNRDSTLIALGGGVIGDVVGFAAATYQRGIRFIQIPTTLLAQVDSSVGGKTAVNHPLGKNMIGAFYQPASVIIDTDTLNTLPHREISAGLAEVIKYGAIFDVDFFSWLEQNIDKLVSLDPVALEYCIQRCCQLKADVVVRDETEKGDRALLNYGHTFGHAIEAYLGYGKWLHGEAIAVGMLEAGGLSHILGNLSDSELARLEKLIARANLPTISPDGMAPSDYLPYMWRDKKVLNGQLRLILLKKLGQAYVSSVATESQVLQAIERVTQV